MKTFLFFRATSACVAPLLIAALLLGCASRKPRRLPPVGERLPLSSAPGTTAGTVSALASASSSAEFRDPFADDADSGASGGSPDSAGIRDPLEKVNRGSFWLNDRLYRWALRPVAKGYRAVTPRFFREGAGRVFDNAKFPIRFVNNALEGRLKSAGLELGRFFVNTTVGIGGVWDPASKMNLKAQPASFDQTLAVWGVPTGAYLHLPVLGSSSPRGVAGAAGDVMANPLTYLGNSWLNGNQSLAGDLPLWVTYSIAGGEVVNDTALHLEQYDALRNGLIDPYAAARSAWFAQKNRPVPPPVGADKKKRIWFGWVEKPEETPARDAAKKPAKTKPFKAGRRP